MTRVRWNLSVVSICIFFMANDSELRLLHLLSIWTLLLRAAYSFVYVLIGLFVLLGFNFLSIFLIFSEY
jgi:hypothetical protein